MKIVSIHWAFIPGGVASYARWLDAVNNLFPIEISSYCIQAPDWSADIEGLKTIRCRMIPIRGRMDPSWIWVTRRALEKENPDLILTHGFNGGFAAVVSGFGLHIPIISSWHGDYFPSTFIQKVRKPLVNLMEKVVYRHLIKEIVTVSEFSRRELVRKGVSKRKIRVIHNGIPPMENHPEYRERILEDLGIPNNHFLIGTACRFVAPKGLSWLLRSFAIVAGYRSDVRFVVWGDGPEKDSLLLLAKELHISRIINFPGYCPDIAECLNALDVFVMSSFTENFSVTLLEAMRAGRPIVATDVGGNGEAIENGVHGFLVPFADPEALAEKILDLISDVGLRTALAENAGKRFRQDFTAEIMIRKTAEWMEMCYEKHGKKDLIETRG